MIPLDPRAWEPADVALVAAGVVFVASLALRGEQMHETQDALAQMAAQRESTGLCAESETGDAEPRNDERHPVPEVALEGGRRDQPALAEVPCEEPKENLHDANPQTRGQ